MMALFSHIDMYEWFLHMHAQMERQRQTFNLNFIAFLLGGGTETQRCIS